jgi:hypothetical protein
MMRRVSMLLVLGGVLLAVAMPRADVAPFPSWRIAANNSLTQAVQVGPTVFIGGAFSKIGRAVPEFTGILDPVSLSFTQASGCATTSGFPIVGEYYVGATRLADGDGAYTVPPETAFVRLRPDCHFDRTFQVRLPSGVRRVASPNAVVAAAGRVYFDAIHDATATAVIVEVDGRTGVLTRYWPSGTASRLKVDGVLPDGRLLASTDTALGVFDTTTGQFQAARGLGAGGKVVHVGAVVLVQEDVLYGFTFTALDARTLLPLPQWPLLRSDVSLSLSVASDSLRFFVAGGLFTVDGDVTPEPILSFAVSSGARDLAWSAPAWTARRSNSFVSDLFISGSRLFVMGDFQIGAQRDTIAALDVSTGALDPWVLPYAFQYPVRIGGKLVSSVMARDRVSRTYMAAVDASTGAIQAWAPDVLPTSWVQAMAVDAAAGRVYVAASREVRRYDAATGALDRTWQLNLDYAGFVPVVSAMQVVGGQLYVTGLFDLARDSASGPWQPREGAAAMSASGVLTAWRPRVRALCAIPGGAGGITFPCVREMQVVAGRIVLGGTVERIGAPGEPARSVMAVDADSGSVDPLLPFVGAGVGPLASDGTTLFAGIVANEQDFLARGDVTGARVVGPMRPALRVGAPSITVRGNRVYGEAEHDADTAVATSNSMRWSKPIALTDGVADLPETTLGVLSWHAEVAANAPRVPTGLVATVDGPRVTLRWQAGSGDLEPFVVPPAPGGTAATSHVVLASLGPGGPAVVGLDTRSAATTVTVDAPPGVFYLRVQATNGFGASAPSNEVAVSVAPAPPGRPQEIVAAVNGPTVSLRWQPPIGGWPATSYLLDAGTAPGLSNIGTLPVNGTTFDAPVPPGRYYVRIRAVNAYGASVPGDEVILDVP